MIRGETAAALGTKSAARAQPMSALPGFILLPGIIVGMRQNVKFSFPRFNDYSRIAEVLLVLLSGMLFLAANEYSGVLNCLEY